MRNFFTSLLIAGLFCTAIILALSFWASTPVVYKSYSSGYCVRIVSPKGELSCESRAGEKMLRGKHEVVWVK